MEWITLCFSLVTEAVQSWVQHQPHSSDELIFRPMMRWFDRHVEILFTEALQQVDTHSSPVNHSVHFLLIATHCLLSFDCTIGFACVSK